MGPLAVFPSWSVLMGHCAGEMAVYGPSGCFSFMGVLMGHCAGEMAVYGSSGYFSFIGCANEPLCRRKSCIWALWLFFLYGVC
jgi:hypothetical protein